MELYRNFCIKESGIGVPMSGSIDLRFDGARDMRVALSGVSMAAAIGHTLQVTRPFQGYTGEDKKHKPIDAIDISELTWEGFRDCITAVYLGEQLNPDSVPHQNNGITIYASSALDHAKLIMAWLSHPNVDKSNIMPFVPSVTYEPIDSDPLANQILTSDMTSLNPILINVDVTSSNVRVGEFVHNNKLRVAVLPFNENSTNDICPRSQWPPCPGCHTPFQTIKCDSARQVLGTRLPPQCGATRLREILASPTHRYHILDFGGEHMVVVSDGIHAVLFKPPTNMLPQISDMTKICSTSKDATMTLATGETETHVPNTLVGELEFAAKHDKEYDVFLRGPSPGTGDNKGIDPLEDKDLLELYESIFDMVPHGVPED